MDEDCAEARRRRMVATQIAARGIRDPRLLDAMRRVPRERFVPDALAALAYDDGPLPIGEEQTISQPYIVALMIDAAAVHERDRVLEVGAGSGYAAALLAELAAEVIAVERLPGLADAARRRIGDRVKVRTGDGTIGVEDRAPFDAILVSAGGGAVPQPLLDQLATGGRLVMPVGGRRDQRLVRITRRADGGFDEEELASVAFVPLIGSA